MRCKKCKCSFDKNNNSWWDYKGHSEPVKIAKCPECEQIYILQYGNKFTNPIYMDLNYIINNHY